MSHFRTGFGRRSRWPGMIDWLFHKLLNGSGKPTPSISVAACSLVEIDRRFRGIYWLYHCPNDGGSPFGTSVICETTSSNISADSHLHFCPVYVIISCCLLISMFCPDALPIPLSLYLSVSAHMYCCIFMIIFYFPIPWPYLRTYQLLLCSNVSTSIATSLSDYSPFILCFPLSGLLPTLLSILMQFSCLKV
jgi:hypothetical protein